MGSFELRMRDRATIFEDPAGLRILYDPGQSALGSEDPRLGRIDVIALSYPHGDHIGDQIETIRGKPTAACAQSGADDVGPFAAPCLATVRTGGTRNVKASATAKAIEITVVPIAQDSTVPLALLSEAARHTLEPDSVGLVPGPPSGYVIRFTNGLTVAIG